MPRPVAALDAGTNTVRLYIAQPGHGGRLEELVRTTRFVGLGEGVDATGRFKPEAIERALQAIDEYALLMTEYDVERAMMVATSASRDAANRAEFFDQVEQRLGFQPDLISGTQEAQLSFKGALTGARDPRGPVLVVDSGGGSTELVMGETTGAITDKISLDVGSRRLRERLLPADPPTAEQIAQARAEVDQQLATVFDLSQVATCIGVAGTVTTMAALLLGLDQYDRAKVHGSIHSADELSTLADRLLTMTVDQVRVLGPVEPKRAPVLCAGALIVAEIASRLPVPLIASEADILDGIGALLANRQSTSPQSRDGGLVAKHFRPS